MFQTRLVPSVGRFLIILTLLSTFSIIQFWAQSPLAEVEIIWESGDTGIRQVEITPPGRALTPADFTSALNGTPAIPVVNDPGWKPYLPSALTAKWIASAPRNPYGGRLATVLYAITFFNPCATTQTAALDFTFAVDERLGSNADPAGLYLNGLAGAIPGSGFNPGSPTIFRDERFFSADLTPMIQPGRNDLFIYQDDTFGVTSGLIFQAKIRLGCRPTMVGQPVMVFFPQVVFGDGNTSSFAVYNPGQQPLGVLLEFRDAVNGQVTQSASPTIPAEGTEVIPLSDPGGLQVGSVKITAEGVFTATEFLDLIVGGQAVPRAGVLPCRLTRRATFYGSDQGGRSTGLAISQPAPFSTANITVGVTDPSGAPAGSATLSLPQFRQSAVFLNALLPGGFDEGTVTVESDTPVCVVSLIQDAAGNLTTVAVSTDDH